MTKLWFGQLFAKRSDYHMIIWQNDQMVTAIQMIQQKVKWSRDNMIQSDYS